MSGTLHSLSLIALCIAAALLLVLGGGLCIRGWMLWRRSPGRRAGAPVAAARVQSGRPPPPIPMAARPGARYSDRRAAPAPVHRATASPALPAVTSGLFNRRVFDLALHCECARVQRSGSRLTLVLLEPDPYHAICVRHGLRAGDDLMRALAARLQALVRCHDIVCQVGDARLALLWSGIPLAVARRRMEQLRRCLADVKLPLAGLDWPPMSLSMGLADHSPLAGRGLLHRAEVALRAARQSGGARLVCWDRWSEPYSYLASVDQLPGRLA